MRNRIVILLVPLFSAALCPAACPSADLTGDCFVDFNDFALLAADWPATDYNDLALLGAQWLTPDPRVPDDMVFIPGGTFEMGDNLEDGSFQELPVHTVTVDFFYMGKYEITNGQYCEFLNSALLQGLITVTDGVVYQAGPGTSYACCDTLTSSSSSQIEYIGGVFNIRTKSGRDMSNDPMVCVSWYGAGAYCNWRSDQEGYQKCYDPCNPNWDCDFSKRGYRLATEAEWEYAARGGLVGKRFPSGDNISHAWANYCSVWTAGHPYYFYDVSPTKNCHPTWDDGVVPYTSPGGTFSANAYGLYDMAGNVVEWCNDWHSGSYYDESPTNNPTGPPAGMFLSRVLRGGWWSEDARDCRVASRGHVGRPASRSSGTGFRIVLDLE